MDGEQLTGGILLTLICVIAALGLWYAGVRLGSLKAKQFAVMIGIMPMLASGLQLGSSWFGRTEYRSVAVGPSSREAVTSTTIPVPVTAAEVPHQLELRPKIRGSDAPHKPVHLKFEVRSPKGESIAVGEGTLAPAQRLRWQPLRRSFSRAKKASTR